MAGVIQGLTPTKHLPEQSPVAVVQPVVHPPAVEKTTTECPHRKTRIVEVRSDFDFDENGKIHYDRTIEPLERYNECLWCGAWLEIEPEPGFNFVW